jgi:hypothetical protein
MPTKNILRKIDWKPALLSAILGGILFCVPIYIFIVRAHYTDSWLLYMGSFLFFIVMWIHTLYDSRKRRHNESTIALVFASHVTTFMGVIIASILSFVLLALLVPGYLDSGMADKQLTSEPANIIHDKTNGLSFQVFFAATIINFSVGSFAGIILPFYTKRNQTRDSKDPAPLHQGGVR